MIINHTSPAEIDANGDDVHIVKQYSHLSKKYLAVHQMVMSVLYIFHGLEVEPGFSAMGDLINKKANWMPGRTYSTIQTEKYSVRAQCPNSSFHPKTQLFKRQNKHYTPVTSILVNNVRTAPSPQKQT